MAKIKKQIFEFQWLQPSEIDIVSQGKKTIYQPTNEFLLVEPYIFQMLEKYNMKYTNRKYLIYFDKKEEANVQPVNDILNKNNKKVSLWWKIRQISHLVVYSKYIIHKELSEFQLSTYDKLQAFIKLLQDLEATFFYLTQEQKDRILSLDTNAKFPENELPKINLDFFEMEKAFLK